MQSSRDSRPFRPQWRKVKVMKQGELTLEIEESTHRPQPRYRFRIGRIYDYEGQPRLGAIQPKIFVNEDGSVHFDDAIEDACDLLQNGEDWVSHRVKKIKELGGPPPQRDSDQIQVEVRRRRPLS